MEGAVGAFLLAVGECSHTLEACPLDKVDELLEVLFRLAGMAHHERGADVYAGHLSAQLLYQLIGLLAVDVPVHGAQHVVGAVLQGDVEIPAYIIMFAHDAQELHGEIGGVGIVQAHPFHSRHFGDGLHQLCDASLMVQIHPIVGEFLCDDLELLHPLLHQQAHLLQYILHGAAAMAACDDGNGAIGASAVASL